MIRRNRLKASRRPNTNDPEFNELVRSLRRFLAGQPSEICAQIDRICLDDVPSQRLAELAVEFRAPARVTSDGDIVFTNRNGESWTLEFKDAPDHLRVALTEIRNSAAHPEAPTHPPLAARFLLRLFVPKRDRQAFIGDLLEEYTEDVLPEFGRFRADLWFWKQSAAAVWAFAARAVIKLSLVGAAVEWLRRHLG